MSLRGRRIAIVEDDPVMGESLALCLALEGAETGWARSAVEARRLLITGAFEACVCDIRLPDDDGEALFRGLPAPPPTLFLTAFSDIDQAVRLLRSGGADYMTKPFDQEVFLERLERILPPPAAEEAPLGISDAMRGVERLLRRVARSDLPVLILGPTGSRPEAAARLLHQASASPEAPFLFAPCAAPPPDMLDDEAGGTLFLDEVTDLSPDAQARLLRRLDAGAAARSTPGGPRAASRAASRVVAASTRLPATSGGRLRDDLRLRFSVIEVRLPPLHERPEDAVWLARRELASRGAPVMLGDLAEEALLGHDWPGDEREALNRIDRALALAEGPTLGPADLFPESAVRGYGGRPIEPLAEIRAAAERRQIQRALRETGGRVAEAATLLDVSRTTLWEKMRRLGLDR